MATVAPVPAHHVLRARFGFTWALLPFAPAHRVSLSLFGPAAAALITAALGAELRDLRNRLTEWRIPSAGTSSPVVACRYPRSPALEFLGRPRQISSCRSRLGIVVFVLVWERRSAGGGSRCRASARFGPCGQRDPRHALGPVASPSSIWRACPVRDPVPALRRYTIALSIILSFLAENTGGAWSSHVFHGASIPAW